MAYQLNNSQDTMHILGSIPGRTWVALSRDTACNGLQPRAAKTRLHDARKRVDILFLLLFCWLWLVAPSCTFRLVVLFRNQQVGCSSHLVGSLNLFNFPFFAPTPKTPSSQHRHSLERSRAQKMGAATLIAWPLTTTTMGNHRGFRRRIASDY